MEGYQYRAQADSPQAAAQSPVQRLPLRVSFCQNDTISQVLKVLFFGYLKHEECLSECRSYDWNFLLAACLLEVCIDETAPERLGVTLARQKFDFFGA